MCRTAFGFDAGTAQLNHNARINFQAGSRSSSHLVSNGTVRNSVNDNASVSHTGCANTQRVVNNQFHDVFAAVLPNEFDRDPVLVDRAASDIHTAYADAIDVLKSGLDLRSRRRVVKCNRCSSQIDCCVLRVDRRSSSVQSASDRELISDDVADTENFRPDLNREIDRCGTAINRWKHRSVIYENRRRCGIDDILSQRRSSLRRAGTWW